MTILGSNGLKWRRFKCFETDIPFVRGKYMRAPAGGDISRESSKSLRFDADTDKSHLLDKWPSFINLIFVDFPEEKSKEGESVSHSAP